MIRTWRWEAGLAVLAALCLGPALPAVRAQEGGNSVYYTRQRAFAIPFQVDPGQRGIQQVLLHVSEDFGKTYQHVANAGPTDRSFRFQAHHDGWYWFTVQTQDQEGRYYPPNLNLVPPGLKVCVDTQAPVVTLKAVPPHEGTVAVEWDIREENLDLLSLRLEYRATGSQDWMTVGVPQVAHGQQGWTPAVQGTIEVRLRVQDKAQNPAEASATVRPGEFQPVPGSPAPEAPRGNIIYVKSRTFQLTYTIEDEGPSGVKNVEVWVTRDTRSWQRYADDARRQGPFTVTVNGEGRYGFTLIPRSGVGLADRPPKIGDQPQVWVEVDETRPVVNLYNVVVGRGAEAGKLTVYWTASDRFLRAQPITISYATKLDGTWTPLATRLANTGSYSRDCQDLPYEFYVKVEAVDEAGNIGSAQTRETVKVDLKIPKVRELNVTPLDPGPPRPAEEPGPGKGPTGAPGQNS